MSDLWACRFGELEIETLRLANLQGAIDESGWVNDPP
jgi:hypothetical protein